jgi:hypothetical protein
MAAEVPPQVQAQARCIINSTHLPKIRDLIISRKMTKQIEYPSNPDLNNLSKIGLSMRKIRDEPWRIASYKITDIDLIKSSAIEQVNKWYQDTIKNAKILDDFKRTLDEVISSIKLITTHPVYDKEYWIFKLCDVVVMIDSYKHSLLTASDIHPQIRRHTILDIQKNLEMLQEVFIWDPTNPEIIAYFDIKIPS